MSGGLRPRFGAAVARVSKHPEPDLGRPEAGRHTLEVWYGRLFLPSDDIEAEAIWSPAGQRVAITRAGPRWKGTALNRAGRAAHALQTFKRRAGGPSAMSDEEAFEEAVRLGLEWLQDNPGTQPADFGRKQLTAKRCTGPDATEKWMKEKHFGVRLVQRELERRFQRPG